MKNELKDSQMKEETVDAGRRTADAWCGSKEVVWWVAAMADGVDADGDGTVYDCDGLFESEGADWSRSCWV